MKKILYLCCLLGLASCNNSTPKTTETVTPTPNGLQGIQQQSNTTITPTTASTDGTQTQANGEALNPAHGAPGHNCAIPVGAPLNSAPKQVNPSPQTNSTVQQQIVPVQTPANTEAIPQTNDKGQKLNPAHGAPGHKCEIPVGSPLT